MTNSKNDVIKKFISTCTVTFNAFDYRCEIVKSSASIWNFEATNKGGDKVFAVFCAPKLNKSKSLIKLANKKIKENMRLVVVTEDHNEEELEKSREEGYALVTLDSLSKYGEEMILIRTKEACAKKSSSFTDS